MNKQELQSLAEQYVSQNIPQGNERFITMEKQKIIDLVYNAYIQIYETFINEQKQSYKLPNKKING